MSYIFAVLKHFNALQAWAQQNKANVTMDVTTFGIEVKAHSRYHHFFPRFITNGPQGLCHTTTLTDSAFGFIGWLPYETPLKWETGSDKLLFKQFLRNNAVPTPDWWSPENARGDFVLKRSLGSFGYEVHGPYRLGSVLPRLLSENAKSKGRLYAEQFVHGENLKVWFWGGSPFFAHLHPYPSIAGSGLPVRRELEAHFRSLGRTMDSNPSDLQAMCESLLYQGYTLEDTLQVGCAVWLDYRYGRRHRREPWPIVSDDDIEKLSPSTRSELLRIGAVISGTLREHVSVPVLYSLDGVIDEAGKAWWLEMNAHPILPPDGYAPMLSSIFGSSGLH